jgi:hypothetical protein
VRDETTEPRDSNHIWLRQSVTFTVNAQTRTVEMALPLRPGATPGEVEALLDEADAGMRRLSRRLDAHLAELLNPSAAMPAPSIPPAPEAPRPAATSTLRPAPEPAASAPRPAVRAPERPAQAAARPPAAAPTAAPTGPDLTIPEFLAQAAAVGFDSRQAMEKLGVRSLTGLNLREALESLRRKALLDGATPAGAPPRPPAGPPLAFEEEEESDAFASEPEMDLSYSDLADLPDDDAEEEEDAFVEESAAPPAPAASAPVSEPPTSAPAPDLNALRRDARLTPASKLPAPARRSGPLSQEASIAETPAAPISEPAPAPEETPAQRSERMLAELRAAHGGGTASKHQRDAFANIVVGELSEKGATALTTAIWNIPPGKLGPEQLDALISWGKRDDFKPEAREVLIAAKRVGPPPAASPEAPAAPPPSEPPARGARSRPASSAEPRGDG